MKLEIPVPAAVAGRLKSSLSASRDVVAEGQLVPFSRRKTGGKVGNGDDIVFVEAMKEIPVPVPAAGRLKSILVSLDDVVAKGQWLPFSRRKLQLR